MWLKIIYTKLEVIPLILSGITFPQFFFLNDEGDKTVDQREQEKIK